MKVLVVGNGGREHALAWKLLQSGNVEQVFCAPGNGGTASLDRCQNLPIAVDDFAGLDAFATAQEIPLIVVGPELPLALGITDALQKPNRWVFGPAKLGAQIEASKSWAKELMLMAGVPTAAGGTFTDAVSAKAFIQQVPIVVKADGLAAGKGVTVAMTLDMAYEAIDSIFSGQFGSENLQVVIEEYLTGQEVSVLALTDGITIRPLLPAQDHKAIGEGDTGPNTGGMGAYTPIPFVTEEMIQKIEQQVLQPTLAELQRRQIDYRGVLYAGLMITPAGEIKVLEFNCRFGDPETQPILSLLETPLDELLLACCQQRLGEMPAIQWKPGAAVCVVIAAGGYPGAYEKGKLITGLTEAEMAGVTVFHAGTRLENQQILTDGGRVLGVTAIGENFAEAKIKAYQGVECIQFPGMYYRRDIGHRVS